MGSSEQAGRGSSMAQFMRTRSQTSDLFTATFTKGPENATVIPQQFRGEIVFRMEHQNSIATLFGASIRLGPSRIQVDRAKVIQLAATMKKFTKAKMGANVPILLRPLVPVRFELVDRAALLPASS